jgi:hypothetical protein
MITLVQDSTNPERILVTATVSLFVDKVLLTALSSEIEAAIRDAAIKDLRSNKKVKAVIAEQAVKKLLSMLGVHEPVEVPKKPYTAEDAKSVAACIDDCVKEGTNEQTHFRV